MDKNDPEFVAELNRYLADFAGRPTPLYYAKRLSNAYGVKIYIKREDLVHGGAHKLNNTSGQALLAKHMGKTRIIAETGAGQHGTAVAMAGANLGIETVVYMGAVDMERQRMNVFSEQGSSRWNRDQRRSRMQSMRRSMTGSQTLRTVL